MPPVPHWLKAVGQWIVGTVKDVWLVVTIAFRSTFNLSIEYFPRIERGQTFDDLRGDKLVIELATATGDFKNLTFANGEEADAAIELAKASLEEAKQQTEYQDDKASRLLTVTSFVSALSGVLLASFIDRYPLDELRPLSRWSDVFLTTVYGTFLLFSLFALFGAVVTFHATRTRFKYSKKPQATNPDHPAKSLLFYQEIIAVSPKGWADSFVTTTPITPTSTAQTSLRADLKAAYLRNYVMEAYLVAAKTADKLRYLGPAQSLLAWALRFLVLFVIFFAGAICLIPETKKPPKAIKVELERVANPVRVEVIPFAHATESPLPPANASSPPHGKRKP